jgi:hypothetical protein
VFVATQAHRHPDDLAYGIIASAVAAFAAAAITAPVLTLVVDRVRRR